MTPHPRSRWQVRHPAHKVSPVEPLKILNLGMRLCCVGILLSCGSASSQAPSNPQPSVIWGANVVIRDPETFTDAGPDARGIRPGTFGAWYPRLLELNDGSWLATYGVYDNDGYLADPHGGVRQEVARSTDAGRSWTVLTTLADPGRDLENGEMVQLANGDVLMAARSVRWGESYRLPVFRSQDKGSTWTYLSTIDSNEGVPGSLANPPQGLYEPHFGFLADGSLAVMYANEKHAIENPSFSQIISERVSPDFGATWGSEIWVAAQAGGARPGMPVWTRMSDGRFLVVFEVCATNDCDIFSKWSGNGLAWSPGLGQAVNSQRGGPFVVSLASDGLFLTSNSGVVSFSQDSGVTWQNLELRPFLSSISWPCLYQIGGHEIAMVVSAPRTQGGARIVARFGSLN